LSQIKGNSTNLCHYFQVRHLC